MDINVRPGRFPVLRMQSGLRGVHSRTGGQGAFAPCPLPQSRTDANADYTGGMLWKTEK